MQNIITRRSALKCSALAGAAGLVGQGFSLVRPAEANEADARRWWKEAVVYEIFPRSFADSNGDGVGDLKGIIGKLDHLKDLGVNVVWLSPHYDTPNVDSGYDIRDFRKVNPEFGTMEDFDAMLAGLKERGIKLVLDLVVNHTSDEHVWFQESRKSKDNPYRDYYIWRDGKPDDSPPNNYPSIFGGSAWTKDDATGQYYLHYYAKQQPDLNWDNPKVRNEVYDLMRFWLDKGVSGFRMDSITHISKPQSMPDLTPDELKEFEVVYVHGPHIHDYLHEMNRKVLSSGDYMALGEAYGLRYDETPDYIAPQRQELDMVFHFDVMRAGRDGWQVLPRSTVDIKKAIQVEATSGDPDGWATSYFENHDNPRSVSRFGDGSQRSAKALAILLMARPGTPYLYQGQEIGMTNIPFHNMNDFADVSAKGFWDDNVPTGKMTPYEVLDSLRQISRDNSRTPMQWSSDAKAGFTTGTPWFRVNPNTKTINVDAQKNDPHSVMSFYRTLIAKRAANLDLIYGRFKDVDPTHPAVFAYVRKGKEKSYLFLINLSAKPQTYKLPDGLAIDSIILDTDGRTSGSHAVTTMTPWHAGIYMLKA